MKTNLFLRAAAATLLTIIAAQTANAEQWNCGCDNPPSCTQANNSVMATFIGGKLYIKGNGAMQNYSSVESVPWNGLRHNITETAIEKGVTSIGNFAFANCTAMIHADIPKTVSSIGSAAFANCTSLKIVINHSFTPQPIGETDFANVNALYVPAGSAFAYRNHDFWGLIQNIFEIQNTWHIGEYDSTSVTAIYDDDNNTLTITGDGEIRDFTDDGIHVTIPWGFFLNMITSVVIKDGITAIGRYNFVNHKSLTSVTIGSTVDFIDDGAFMGCSALMHIALYGDVPAIHGSTFDEFKANVYVPSESLMGYQNHNKWKVFRNLKDLKEIQMWNIGAPNETAITATLTGRTLTITGSGAMKNFANDIFADVTRRAPWFFPRATITEVKISNGITNIGDYAFDDCINLTYISIPGSVQTIGQYAFNNCRSLNIVKIPGSVTTIGSRAFANCSAIKNLYIYAAEPPSINAIEFFKVPINKFWLFVPAGKEAAYRDAPVWKDFLMVWDIGSPNATAVSAVLNKDDNLTIMGSGAMQDWDILSKVPWYSVGDKIKTVTIDRYVTNIGKNAFYCCPNLTTVTNMGYDVTTIGENAFRATNLIKAYIPRNINTIGESAFCNCDSLQEVTITDKVTNIGEMAFKNCNALIIFANTARDPQDIDPNVFENVNIQNVHLLMPDFSFSKYEEAPVWKEFSTSILVRNVTIEGVSTLYVGESDVLTGRLTPANAISPTLIWKSETESVVRVGRNGVVTALAAGTAIIRVTTSNNKTATHIITVKPGSNTACSLGGS